MKIISFIIIISLVIPKFDNTILSRRRVPHSYYRPNNQPPERQLYDDVYDIKSKKYSMANKLTNPERKLRFLKIVKDILQKAKKSGRQIKKVIVGSDLKNLFKNKNLTQDMGKFLNDRKLSQKIRKLQDTIKKQKKKQKRLQRRLKDKQKIKKLNEELKKMRRDLKLTKKRRLMDLGAAGGATGGGATGGATGGAAGGLGGGGAEGDAAAGATMKFSYQPGFGGPFGGMPPMMMGSVNMHPPVNVTVNRIPDPNPNAKLNPLEIQKANLETQNIELKDVQSKLGVLDNMLDGIDQDMSLNLDDKNTKIMQLG